MLDSLNSMCNQIDVPDEITRTLLQTIVPIIVEYISINAPDLTEEEFQAFLERLTPEQRVKIEKDPKKVIKADSYTLNSLTAALQNLANCLLEMHDNVIVSTAGSMCEKHRSELIEQAKDVIARNSLARLLILEDKQSQLDLATDVSCKTCH